MKRTVALAAGIGAAALLSLGLGTAVRAGEKADTGKAGSDKKVEVEKSVQKSQEADQDERSDSRIERRVVIRGGGGFLGVGLEDVNDGRGASVRSVEDGSPAAKAGIKQGDVVVRFDGESVRSAAHLSRLVAETPADRSVPIEVTRDGVTQKLSATLGERRGARIDSEAFPGMRSFRFEIPEPPDAPEAPDAPRPPRAPRAFRFGDGSDDVLMRLFPGGPRKLGLEYIEMGEQLAAAYKLQARGGVLVTSVDPAGPAAKAGIKAGDVVLKFQGRAIESADELRDAVAEAEGGAEVAVTVQREGRPLELKATLANPETRRRSRSSGVRL